MILTSCFHERRAASQTCETDSITVWPAAIVDLGAGETTSESAENGGISQWRALGEAQPPEPLNAGCWQWHIPLWQYGLHAP